MSSLTNVLSYTTSVEGIFDNDNKYNIRISYLFRETIELSTIRALTPSYHAAVATNPLAARLLALVRLLDRVGIRRSTGPSIIGLVNVQ